MHAHPRREKRLRPELCVLFLLLLLGTPLANLAAQPTIESGSTTVDAADQPGMETPVADSEPGTEQPNQDKKKDDRPRELGVLILIVWILAGTGIGILIFTSLFGHSVRSMIRRPYPPQTHPDHQTPAQASPEPTSEAQTDESKSPDE